jgi:N-acetylglucosamine kinase-like BadF-type ATPase
VKLGLDAGGTATRWVLADGDRIVARGTVAGFSGHLFERSAVARLATLLGDLAAALPARPQAITAGVTGLTAGAPAADQVQALLAATFDLPPPAIEVVNDLVIAHRAAFAPGHGIVLLAGTGSIAAHVDAAGTLISAGGRGALIDDAGSAYWIAITALRRVLRQEDVAPGSGFATRLGASLAAAIGGSDWHTIRARIYGADRGSIADLARAVVDADDIFDAAAAELLRLTAALRHRIGDQPIVATGGAFALTPRLAAGIAPIPVRDLDAAAAAAR